MRRPAARVIVAFAAIAALFAAIDEAAAEKKKKKNLLDRPSTVEALSGPMTLSSVNLRWSGARAQTRINLPIKKGSDKQGWSGSEWMRATGESIKMRFSVNRREDLWEVLPQKNLLAGVRLICDGWSVQNPKKGQGIQIDFRFENYPAKARAEFNTDLEHLADVERFLRFNVMAVTRSDERLTSPGTGSPAPAPSPPALAPASPSARPAPAQRTLDIASAEVRPAVVSAGGEVELVIEYAVSSGDGSPVEVAESRTVAKGTVTVAAFPSTVVRPPGTYTAAQSIRIPPDAPAGFYSFKAEVSFSELSDVFTAIFEVR